MMSTYAIIPLRYINFNAFHICNNTRQYKEIQCRRLQYPDKSVYEFIQLATYFLTIIPILSTMPHTLLSLKSTNAHVLKKKKTSRKKLSPHKCSMIESIHFASISSYEISYLTQTLESTIWSII